MGLVFFVKVMRFDILFSKQLSFHSVSLKMLSLSLFLIERNFPSKQPSKVPSSRPGVPSGLL